MVENRSDKDRVENPISLESRISRMEIIILGDPTLGIEGLLPRIGRMEDSLSQLLQQRQEQRNLLRGIAIGLAVTSVSGVGTLLSILSKVFG